MTTTGTSYLVSLVLQSKKALQHGEQLCQRANDLTNKSAAIAVDLQAVDAKVKWMTDAIQEQLMLATGFMKKIEQKKAQLLSSIQEWDRERTRRTEALDTILESLGSQTVPEDFYQTSPTSSIFGVDKGDPFEPDRSPTATLRGNHTGGIPDKNRMRWKTLRDFVDERAIEQVLDTIESDRNNLEHTLGRADTFSDTLSVSIQTIQKTLPELGPPPSIGLLISTQEQASLEMAQHLESLTAHYDQIANALKEVQAGETYEEEDIANMNRDVEELPAIIGELETAIVSIEASHERMTSAKVTSEAQLKAHETSMDDLDELGEIMGEILGRQEDIETDCTSQLLSIQAHLDTLGDLHGRYISYQASFNALVVEIARRRIYRDNITRFVHEMRDQLDAMVEEENERRDGFRKSHGAHLPDDICLFVDNLPTRWDIMGEDEPLPAIEENILMEARDRLDQHDLGDGVSSI